MIEEIKGRDSKTASLWFTGPPSFTAQAARDRRTLLAEVERLKGELDRINKIIFAEGAALGSPNYFAVRGICCDNVHGRKDGGAMR